MSQHDDSTGQQKNQGNSTEWTPSGEQAPAQEEGRLTSLEASDPGHYGMVPAQEAEHEQMHLQEHGMPQGEVSPSPQEALESDVPTSDHQEDTTSGCFSGELPEREVVPVPATRLEAEGEEPLNEQAV